MPSHNSGRKGDQVKTKKKRKAEKGKRVRVNKYEKYSHAGQEQDKIAREGARVLDSQGGRSGRW